MAEPAGPWDKPPRWMLAVPMVLAALVAAVLVYYETREPEVVHDADGSAWYRLRGDDAQQQAVEACVRLDDRRMVFGGPSVTDNGAWSFCCAPRASDGKASDCDLPATKHAR